MHPASWLWAPVAIKSKRQVCMHYLSCTLQSSSNLVMNKHDLQAKRMDEESNKNSILQETSSKSPACFMPYKRGRSPGLSLALTSAPTHNMWLFLSLLIFATRRKVVNDAGRAYGLISTSPRAVGTQVLCRVKISLPLPNYLIIFTI